MEYGPWMENITVDDLPNDDLKFIANEAGMKYAMLIIALFNGTTVSIPNNPFSKLRENYIFNHYDGTKYSINKLAVECKLTTRQIYRIIRKRLEKKKDS